MVDVGGGGHGANKFFHLGGLALQSGETLGSFGAYKT